jgi:hypothetical protein
MKDQLLTKSLLYRKSWKCQQEGQKQEILEMPAGGAKTGKVSLRGEAWGLF